MLGERDLALLAALAEHKILSTYQLYVLFFTSQRRAQDCVQRLRACGLIQTFTWRGATAGARSSDRHFLSERGASVVAASLGCSRKDLGWIPRSEEQAKTRMPHLSGVNAFFCSLVEATLASPGYGLATWRPEHRLATPYGVIQPDGAGRLLHPRGEIEYVFEYDRRTENRAALARKLAAYCRIIAGSAVGRFPNVVFAVVGEDREAALRSILLEALSEQWVAAAAHPGFYAASVTRLRRAGPLGVVWTDLLGHPGEPRLRLEDLPSGEASDFDLAECLGRRWRTRSGEGAA